MYFIDKKSKKPAVKTIIYLLFFTFIIKCIIAASLHFFSITNIKLIYLFEALLFLVILYFFYYIPFISSQKRSNELIDEFEVALETSMDGFWILDIEGKLLYANDSYCKMSGYERAELLEMKITDLDANESIEENKAHIERVIKQGYDSFITKHRHKSGKLIDFEISTTYINFNNGRFFVYLKDITEKQNTLKIVKNQYKKLYEIAYLQSHQVRNPISNILGIIELIDFENLDASENKELLINLKKTTEDFDFIIKQIVSKTNEIKKITIDEIIQ